jgi:hypothetical protein
MKFGYTNACLPPHVGLAPRIPGDIEERVRQATNPFSARLAQTDDRLRRR